MKVGKLDITSLQVDESRCESPSHSEQGNTAGLLYVGARPASVPRPLVGSTLGGGRSAQGALHERDQSHLASQRFDAVFASLGVDANSGAKSLGRWAPKEALPPIRSTFAKASVDARMSLVGFSHHYEPLGQAIDQSRIVFSV